VRCRHGLTKPALLCCALPHRAKPAAESQVLLIPLVDAVGVFTGCWHTAVLASAGQHSRGLPSQLLLPQAPNRLGVSGTMILKVSALF
jgi:hypothetical protein